MNEQGRSTSTRFIESASKPFLSEVSHSPSKKNLEEGGAYLAAQRLAKDLRGFIIARHPKHGYLLLRSFKRKKGEHFQLPGGRVDPEDVLQAISLDLERIAQIAAAREFFEETGINLKQNLERLKSLRLHEVGKGSYFYFELLLTQEDSIATDIVDQTHQVDYKNVTIDTSTESSPTPSSTSRPIVPSTPITGEQFRLRLSSEHTGFCFVQSLEHAANLTSQHSGGHSSSALQQYFEKLKLAGVEMLCSSSSHMESLTKDVLPTNPSEIFYHQSSTHQHLTNQLSTYQRLGICLHACCSSLLWWTASHPNAR